MSIPIIILLAVLVLLTWFVGNALGYIEGIKDGLKLAAPGKEINPIYSIKVRKGL